jgi:hypothetical protein
MCSGDSANAVPPTNKLRTRVTNISGDRRGQPNRSAMERPHSGPTGLLIAVQPVPGKYNWDRLCMAPITGSSKKRAASYMCVPIKSVQEEKNYNDRNCLHSRHHSNFLSWISEILKRTRSGCLSLHHTRALRARVSTPVRGQNSCFHTHFVASRATGSLTTCWGSC